VAFYRCNKRWEKAREVAERMREAVEKAREDARERERRRLVEVAQCRRDVSLAPPYKPSSPFKAKL
jgi:hypothetical protein